MGVLDGRWYIVAEKGGDEKRYRTPYLAMMAASSMEGEVDMYTEEETRIHVGHRTIDGEWTQYVA